MKRGFHLIDIPPEFAPQNGLSWAWRWVKDDSSKKLGIAFVWPGKTLLCLWVRTTPLNTMRVEADV